ncbi:uncharacterized protein [Gossypium hirsutum]|uniref:Reverse transcriptase/retrotransposon-derived protein RNase H-like domain-containing protein n=1 Tax=Gossypium hirsutum TaxID=3635 RepID=A0A1U8PVT2_GOSHI|nr:uncharacterized protein LOC107887649 [Gossypium hirsutum]
MELPFNEFDLILGTDWLVEYRVSLDCATRRVTLRPTENDEVIMIGEHWDFLSNVISTLVADKLEFPGVPLDREVELRIDLLLDTSLVSIAPYACFLGLAGYYRRFAEGFSLIASPLTKLLRKNAPFVWSEAQQFSFDKLKFVLTEAPVLVQQELGRQFVVYSDTLHVGLGFVLMQE